MYCCFGRLGTGAGAGASVGTTHLPLVRAQMFRAPRRQHRGHGRDRGGGRGAKIVKKQ